MTFSRSEEWISKGRSFSKFPSRFHFFNQTCLRTSAKIHRSQSIVPVQPRAQGKIIVAFFVLTSVEPQSFVYYPYGLNTLIQIVWRINTLKNRCWAIVPDNDSLGRVSESSLKAMSAELPRQNNRSHHLLWGGATNSTDLVSDQP